MPMMVLAGVLALTNPIAGDTRGSIARRRTPAEPASAAAGAHGAAAAD
jgi:hypothetical protein